MKIKNHKCKCGHDDFFFAYKGNQKGIYCSYCGKWLKWADKDEQNLVLKQEPFINKSCVSSRTCEHDKQNVLDKIKTEINDVYKGLDVYDNNSIEIFAYEIDRIIDKYRRNED